jgi:hypothetical protein
MGLSIKVPHLAFAARSFTASCKTAFPITRRRNLGFQQSYSKTRLCKTLNENREAYDELSLLPTLLQCFVIIGIMCTVKPVLRIRTGGNMLGY